MNEIEIIDNEIAEGKSSITHTIIAKYHGYKIKVSVKSDNNPHKCSATLYMYEPNSMNWNANHSISPSTMKTISGLKNRWDKSKDEIEYQTRKDMDKLFDMAIKLLED